MKYPRYPKYKDGGVEWLGEVPEGWEVKRLSAFFGERKEKVNDTDYPALSVGRFGVVPQIETAAKTDAGDNRKLVCINDFVINSRSDRKGAAGVSSLDGSVSLIYIVLTTRQGIYSPFIHHLLRSINFQEEFYRYGKGIVADLWSTNYSEMKNILLAMPSRSEQQTIAAFLDHNCTKIDAMITEQEKLIALLREKRQAVISHAVTKGLNPDAPMKDSGVAWLGEVPEEWEINRIKFSTIKIEQGWSPQCSNYPAEEDEWGVLKVGSVNGGKFTVSENKALPSNLTPPIHYEIAEGDILMSRANTRELLGSVALVQKVRKKIILCDKLYRIVIKNNFSKEFFCYTLQSPISRYQYEREATGASSSMQNIGQDTLKNTIIAVPPIPEQQAIVTHLDAETAKIDTLIGESEKAVALLKERRNALISAAVTGKIDVRDIPLQEAV